MLISKITVSAVVESAEWWRWSCVNRLAGLPLERVECQTTHLVYEIHRKRHSTKIQYMYNTLIILLISSILVYSNLMHYISPLPFPHLFLPFSYCFLTVITLPSFLLTSPLCIACMTAVGIKQGKRPVQGSALMAEICWGMHTLEKRRGEAKEYHHRKGI